MALNTYVTGEDQPDDGWLISTWDQYFSPTEWQADNVYQDGAVTVLRLDGTGANDLYAGGEVQSSAAATIGTWTWCTKAPEMISGTVFGMFLFQSSWQDERLEFDMEIVGDDPSVLEVVVHTAMADGTIEPAARRVNLGFDPSDAFNVYEISLTGGSATFFVNGSVVATFDAEDFQGYWRSGEVRAYSDLWATSNRGWAGTLDPSKLPITAEILSAGWTLDVVQPDHWVGTAASNTHRGTALGDRLRGEGGDDHIYGEAGNDQIYGGTGSDILSGWTGRDTLDGGSGRDRLTGGTGNDTYIVTAGDIVIEDARAGKDGVRASCSHTLAQNVEYLVLTGTSALNGTGNNGGNVLTGNSSANVLKGLSGSDTLRGGYGKDTLWGGDGADQLVGGAGRDTMTGGKGNDAFVFAKPSEGHDQITDFSNGRGNNDFFRIDAENFGGGLTGGHWLDQWQFRSRHDNLAQDGNDRVIFRTTDQTLWLDSDGKGGGAQC